jgi:phosphopantothenoylcysteine decarboxylase/phosphopantothenate--cysteine ligase
MIAKDAYERGANVTLFIGPGRTEVPKQNQRLKIVRFKYFEELRNLVEKYVSMKKYHIFIHSAAVSDYEPLLKFDGKIKSNSEKLTIHFRKTIKIVDLIKKIDPNIFLVKFKLEVNTSKEKLISIAKKSMDHSMADIIVANDFNCIGKKHKAFILDKNENLHDCVGKEVISKKLLDLVLFNFKK